MWNQTAQNCTLIVLFFALLLYVCLRVFVCLFGWLVGWMVVFVSAFIGCSHRTETHTHTHGRQQLLMAGERANGAMCSTFCALLACFCRVYVRSRGQQASRWHPLEISLLTTLKLAPISFFFCLCARCFSRCVYLQTTIFATDK